MLNRHRLLLPKYPTFRYITLEDKIIFDHLTKTHGPYSDFNFTSIYTWDINSNAMVSMLNGNLLLKIKDYIYDQDVLSIFGDSDIFNTLHILKNDGYNLKLIPQIVYDKLNDDEKAQLNIKEDPDNHDYLIDIRNFVALEGNEYKNLRKKIRSSIKKYESTDIVELEINNQEHYLDVQKLTNYWRTQKDASEDNENEILAINRLKDLQNVELINIGIYLNNELIGYTINEIINDLYAIGHFGKSNYKYRNLSLFLEYKTAQLLHDRKIKYINLEQDLGSSGLKASKLSYKPSKFLKKYKIHDA